MALLATPDFGASGGIVCCGLVVLLAVVALSVLGVCWGFRLRRRESAKARRTGTVLIATCCALPFVAYYGPAHLIRLVYGNYPLGRYPNGVIQEGMTKDEVIARLGTPHERHGDESWYYYIDSIGAFYFGVRFGPDGRVVGTHGN